jgi:hypothetical protein
LDIKTQYIIQAVTNAANNLRLSSEKIEVVTLVRERLSSVENLDAEISRLKKITEFSKFAVKLSQIYAYISGSLIDFNKISEQFGEHSHMLVRELSNLLDVVTPVSFHKILEGNEDAVIDVDLTDDKRTSIRLEDLESDKLETVKNLQPHELLKSETEEEKKKENIEEILEREFDYDLFVQYILEPVKEMDEFFQKLESGYRDNETLEKYYDKMLRNKNLSSKAGLEIVTKMHNLLFKAFDSMRQNKLEIEKENIESLRACLIVIVAVVRQKEVDISGFLDKAERLNKLFEMN